ncbi:hypothetical protein F4604DRAFT_1265784 [Suillus subluteus]|nr:hypothetical protein F4604DRAFT_1265784 [Suillus subluteus]
MAIDTLMLYPMPSTLLCFCMLLVFRRTYYVDEAGLLGAGLHPWYDADTLVLRVFPLSTLFSFCIHDPLLFDAIFHDCDLHDFTIQFVCRIVIVNVCLIHLQICQW